jgi:hypothetical protein
MARYYKVRLNSIVCANSRQDAERVVLMATSTQIIESMSTYEVSHNERVDERKVYHAHNLR